MRLALRLALLIVGVFVIALAPIVWEQERLLEKRFEDSRAEQAVALLAALDEGAVLAWENGGRSELTGFLDRLATRQKFFAISLVHLESNETDGQGAFARLPEEAAKRAREGERVVYVDHRATPAVMVAVDGLAIRDGDGRRLGVALVRPLNEKSSFVQASLRSFLLSTGLTIFVSLAVAAVLGARLISNPLERIVQKARLVGCGDFTIRFREDGGAPEELAMLIAELDSMVSQLGGLAARAEREGAARVAAVEGMRHNDRLATVGTLAAGIAHELGTPLHVVAGRAKRIAVAVDVTDRVKEEAESIRTQAERMRQIVEQLLTFARKPAGPPSVVVLGDVARRVLEWLEPVARRRDVGLEFSGSSIVRARVHVALVEQALTNVTMNALQAVAARGSVRISIHEERRAAPGESAQHVWAVVEIADDGPGIADEIRNKIFDPFFTTKSVGDGTGLGLAITHEILHEHGGFVQLESSPAADRPHGTTMQLFFRAEAT